LKAKGQGLIYRRGAVWWIQYYVRGQRFRESSGSSNRSDAVRLLKQRYTDAQAGRPLGPQPERTTFDELAAILFDDYQANGRRSLDRAEDAINRLRSFFGRDARAIDITADRVTAYRVHRQEQSYKGRLVANSTINYELAILGRAFRLATRARKVTPHPEIEMLHTDNARQGFFEREQYQAVLDRLPVYLHPVMTAAYITGWRTKSELLSRQWRHIDLEAGWLRLDPGESKNGEGRMFPLTPELRVLLETQRDWVRSLERLTGRIIPWVFVYPDGTPIRDYRHAWAKACDAAGMSGRLVHDLRRTAVRNLERAGVPRSAALKVTGHKTETVYRRYAIVDEGMMREAADKLAALHQADTSKRTAAVVVAFPKGN
jgi:integrase